MTRRMRLAVWIIVVAVVLCMIVAALIGYGAGLWEPIEP